MTDALVRAAQQGDGAALDALLRRHHDRIHAVCRRLAGNDADALDATQEALIAIVRGLIRASTGAPAFSTWAYRVATNACLDELRRRRRRPVPGLPDDDADDRRAGAATPAAASTAVPDRLAIDDALEHLPPSSGPPVVLRDLCDLDYAEIADDPRHPARHRPLTHRPRPRPAGPSCSTAGTRRRCPGASNRRATTTEAPP